MKISVLKTAAIVLASGAVTIIPFATSALAQAKAKAKPGGTLSTEQLYQQATRDYEGKNFELAEKKLLRVLKTDPNHFRAKAVLNYVRDALARDPGRSIRGQFRSVIIPRVVFDKVTVDSAIEYLRAKAREVSKGKVVPNILINDSSIKERVVSLNVTNMPLSEILFYIGAATGVKFRYETHSVVASPGGKPGVLKFRRHDRVSQLLTQRLQARIKNTKIAKVEFDSASVDDVVAFLSLKISDQTNGKFQPNFVIVGEPVGAVTLKVDNMPVSAILRYVGNQAKINFSYEPFAIVGSANSKPLEPLVKQPRKRSPLPFEKDKEPDDPFKR